MSNSSGDNRHLHFISRLRETAFSILPLGEQVTVLHILWLVYHRSVYFYLWFYMFTFHIMDDKEFCQMLFLHLLRYLRDFFMC